jgi:sugar phosphate isomerase/epimerase
MKLGAFVNVSFPTKKSLDEALDAGKEAGLDAVEIGGGGFLPKGFMNPEELLKDDKKRKEFQQKVEKRGLFISALSVHGNMVHPETSIADQHRRDFRDIVQLAGKLGVERVIGFAGCPGASEKDTTPNWITCPWPDYFTEALKWQWEQKLIPLWKEEAGFARQHGVKMIALEMHPGDAVYNPAKLLRLREAVGEEIGANFDPSHLFWQGINVPAAIRALRDCIFHVHAKDTHVEMLNVQIKGVLDTEPYANEEQRSWLFRSVGYGNDHKTWKDILSTLRLVGYDYVLSIEHEDSLMSTEEGVRKGVQFLKEIMIEEPRGKMWWD